MNVKSILCAAVAFLFVLISTAGFSQVNVKTGGIKIIPIQTPKGTFNVWTKTIGNNAKIKVLLLHGGPGGTHEYFECLEDFFPKENIEFIYYDQLGSGYSDNITDESLWDIDRYVEEVEQVRKSLNLDRSNFYLYGVSWGAFLSLQYALKYQENLKGLVVSNGVSSSKIYNHYADSVLAKQIDPVVLKELKAIEAAGDFQNPRYMELLGTNFYNKFICRLPIDNWPDPVKRTFAHANQKIYTAMQGPSEFGLSGKLENWDVTDRIKEIKVPTLFITGKYDTMDVGNVKWMSTEVKNGKFLFCPNGSHMSLYDDQEYYMKGLISFLKERR